MARKRPHFDLPEPELIMEGVTPDSALEFWQWRAKLTDEEAKALGEGARCRAFYVSGLARHDLVMLVSDGMEEALKNGETLEGFKERIAEAIRTQGWHDYRVENIFRTNMQTAYAAGRYKKMQAVKKSRPYWQYMAIMDRRVRPSHAILNGMVYPADHEFWKTNYPPNGFRCRCGVRSLSARQVKRMGLEVRKDMPGPGVWTDPKTEYEYFVHFPGADKGFRNNPGRDWVESGLDLKKSPDVNKKAWEKLRGPASRRPAPVTTDAELAEAIRRRCSQFAADTGIRKVITESGMDGFMATDSKGTLRLNFRTYPPLNNFNPLRDLRSGWNKLARGKTLTFNEEYAFESLWHELIHNRQKPGNLGRGETPQRLVMEIFTQWTARRTYPRLLEALGGKAAHQAAILKKGYGYGDEIRNFDRLLKALGIDDKALLPEMQRIMATVSRADYDSELKELLAEMSGREFMRVAYALNNIGDESFEKVLVLTELI